MITKWLLKYIQLAISINHVWDRNACWKPGSKKAPRERSSCITWTPFANATASRPSAIPRTSW